MPRRAFTVNNHSRNSRLRWASGQIETYATEFANAAAASATAAGRCSSVNGCGFMLQAIGGARRKLINLAPRDSNGIAAGAGQDADRKPAGPSNKGMQNSSSATPGHCHRLLGMQMSSLGEAKSSARIASCKTRTRTPRPAVDATIKLGKHILLHGVFSGVFVDRYGPFSSFSGRAAPAPRPRAFT